MGTTLTNGIYLPNEGEKNCYAGLKTNWETLDQKIADIAALQQAVAGALHREIVESLPTTDIDPNTIYMILSGTSATENVYNEFMYVNNAWELIGTSATDLTNYYTKGEVDGLLLLKANASDLTSHTGDTTIHVTASDKAKWDTVALIKQLRLVNAQVGSSTTIAFANIDDTNGIKVGDKCMDLDAKMFEITAVDTTNQTVTVGSALIDLALDANVVHTSGNETISGTKTFLDVPITLKSSTVELGVTGGNTKVIFTDKNLLNLAGITFGSYESSKLSYCRFHIYDKDSNNQEVENFIEFSYVNNNQTAYFRPNKSNFVNLGTVSNRWSKVYANEYYYGLNNIEFSTKFVTTDTNQTISGNKTFSGNVSVYNSDTSVDAKYLILKNQKVKRGSTTETGSQFITFHDKDSGTLVSYETNVLASGNIQAYINVSNLDANSQRVVGGVKVIKTPTETWFTPDGDNTVSSGLSNYKWKDVNTYLVNGLTPSSLGMPATTGTVDISGYVTDLTGGNNQYTAPENGWISVTVIGTSIAIVSSSWSDSRLRPSSGNVRMLYPVLKNETLTISIVATTLAYARFFPCQGNI